LHLTSKTLNIYAFRAPDSLTMDSAPGPHWALPHYLRYMLALRVRHLSINFLPHDAL